jgi:hypothetical protein
LRRRKTNRKRKRKWRKGGRKLHPSSPRKPARSGRKPHKGGGSFSAREMEELLSLEKKEADPVATHLIVKAVMLPLH